GTMEKITMIEAGANEIPNEIMLQAIKEGHKEIKKVCEFITVIQKEIGKPKFEYPSFKVDETLYEEIAQKYKEEMYQAVQAVDKTDRDENIEKLTKKIENYFLEKWGEEELENQKTGIADAIYKLEKKCVREMILKEHKRVD